MDCMPEIPILRDLTRCGQSLTKFFFVSPRLLPTIKPGRSRSTKTLPELPEDILISIFANLEIPDLIRASSVCLSWHSAYIVSVYKFGLYKQPSQQTPCLLYTTESGPDGESDMFLYSLAESKSYVLSSLPDPPIRSRHIIGSSHGWIITTDSMSELHLLNPITGDQIALPPITTIEQIDPVYDDNGVLHRYRLAFFTGEDVDEQPRYYTTMSCQEFRDIIFLKAILSADPSTGNYYVVLIHNPSSQLSFARGGDDKWTWLPQHYWFADCIFKDGMLYALTRRGEIHVFDLGGSTITHKKIMGASIHKFYDNKIYLIQDRCGDVLQIWRGSLAEIEESSESSLEDEEPLHEYEEPLHEDEEAVHEYEEPLHEDEEPLHEDEESLHQDGDTISELDSEPECHTQYTTRFEVYEVDFATKMLVERTSLGEDLLFLGHNQSFCLRGEEHPQLKANHIYYTQGEHIISFRHTDERDISVLDLQNNICEKALPEQRCSNWPGPVWMHLNPRKITSDSHNN
uniref:F-box domain-containing protein n=1 Tax=Oryza punctata TaxID=4537 RepID=A0A0E0MGI8_ORYPU